MRVDLKRRDRYQFTDHSSIVHYLGMA
jgi:hypothetical protein